MHSQQNRYLYELIDVLSSVAGDKEFLHAFLRDLLSPTEYRELCVRWQIVKQLSAGISHRQVAKNLGVSVATVSRGARTLSGPKGGFQRILSRKRWT